MFSTLHPDELRARNRRRFWARVRVTWELLNGVLLCFNLSWSIIEAAWPPIWARVLMAGSSTVYILWRIWMARRAEL